MLEKVLWDSKNILYISNEVENSIDNPNQIQIKNLRSKIEPWLSAIFQSEHLSLLIGTGLTTAVVLKAGVTPQAMQNIEFKTFGKEIKDASQMSAELLKRGEPNLEDDLRTAIELLKGLEILRKTDAVKLKEEINDKLLNLLNNLLKNENNFLISEKYEEAINYLKSFLISFSSRTASRDRLHIFTTNYDRFIEYALDLCGVYILDRFIGKIKPILSMNKMEIDFHYNPPGIRGEPRYVEGVVRFTKLHGSLDWKSDNSYIIKEAIPFGIESLINDKPYDTKVIYPNSSKGIDTAFFPYSELFRDFSTATCKPNSVLVTYGYGFGDSHINNIIYDMLKIPSTHILIISYDNASGRIEKFLNKVNPSQVTLMIGKHFGDLTNLVDYYLPKAGIDRITERRVKIEEKRGINKENELSDKND